MWVFKVNNQTLEKSDTLTPATDSVGYLTVKFDFLTDDWADTTKTAIFKSKNGVFPRALTSSGECKIPAEAISRGGKGHINLTVSVVGVRPGGYRIPSTEKTIRFNNSGFVEGVIFEDISEDPIALLAEIERLIDESEGISVTPILDKIRYLIEKTKTDRWFYETYINAPVVITVFQSNLNITSVPLFDVSQKTNFTKLFYGCKNLVEVPLFDTSNGTVFTQMFYNCTSLKSVPKLDFSKGKTVINLFYNCISLETTPPLDLPEATSFSYVVYGCSKLKTIPYVNCPKVTNFNYAFDGCPSLTNITFEPECIKEDISILSSALSADSIQSIINGLAVVETSKKLRLSSTIINKLTDNQMSEILNKNWTVS